MARKGHFQLSLAFFLMLMMRFVIAADLVPSLA